MQDFFSVGGQLDNYQERKESSDGENNFSSCFDLASTTVSHDEFVGFD